MGPDAMAEVSLYKNLETPVDTSKSFSGDLKEFLLKSILQGSAGLRARTGITGSTMKLPESTQNALQRLQQQKPVDQAWVENWAKEAGVPIKDIRGQDTKYMRFDTLHSRSGEKLPTVRIPQDEFGHLGTHTKSTEIGNYFDTGLGFTKKMSPSKVNQVEPSILNQSGMSYAHPEALDAALKYRLHPPNKNWLIPEEMAPRLPTPKSTPEAPMSTPNPEMFKLPYNIPTIAEMLAAIKK